MAARQIYMLIGTKDDMEHTPAGGADTCFITTDTKEIFYWPHNGRGWDKIGSLLKNAKVI